MTNNDSIEVTSHISRDFLQNAAYFNTMPKLVWEYVANSLDAAKENEPVIVMVDVTSNYVTISDNGIGMSRNDLNNFFKMHGENIRRKIGKRVRGRFGTGKSAAFGLADTLQIDTSQGGLRNVVKLTRQDIEQAENGKPFPVKDIIVNQTTDGEDGTKVEIRDFNIRRPNVDQVVTYIERHLSRYKQRALVSINGHECHFQEPLSNLEIDRVPPPDVAKHIGNVKLIIKVSPSPLNDEVKGIDILSHGIWHGTTLAGIENKERANYIFGQIDIPILEDGKWKVPAFDNTRNNTLNLQNPVVAVLVGWLYEELELVRQQLVEKERERRDLAATKQLEKEARRIAKIINDDFAFQELELELKRKIAKRSGGKSVSEIIDDAGELWPGGGDEITPWEQTGAPHGSGKRGDEAGEGEKPRPGPTVRPGQEPGTRNETKKGSGKRRKSVFSIDFYNGTDKAERSRYDSEIKTIFINLDHPQVSYAFEMGGKKVNARQFREICYEIAAVEYAMVLPHEKVEKDEMYNASDALYDVRETVNRIIRRFMEVIQK
ncbi:MAG: ATP-binding protein [Candidatus Hodarchaeales archaeon]